MGKLHACIVAASLATLLGAQSITLDGQNVSTQDIKAIAQGAKVLIDKKALKRAETSHQILLDAAKEGQKIYGLTVGVGLNKDKDMVDAKGNLSDEVIKASTEFNIGLIRAHCGGVGDDMDILTARAVLATRLNNMLYGATGVQSKVISMYKEMLNNNIIPAMPKFGSMGEADITILGHVGLAMMGEGDVYYNGKRTSAKSALAAANLKPLTPFGKDSLSILSSNAYSSALAALNLEELKQIFKISKEIYALSLEAFNGNVAPFLKNTANLRPFPGFVATAKDVREILAGSYLWEQDDTRALQDPLSFRDGVYILSTLKSTIDELDGLLKIQLNSSDDNPGIAIKASGSSYQEKKLLTKSGGAVIPTANFEPIIWVVELEKAAIILAHNSSASAQRTIKLSDDGFTKLSRFLATPDTVHAFGAMQKPFVALAGQNQFLANPISLNYTPVAGNIEDVATNAPQVALNLQKQIENLYYILGMELMHAAQAIDLRKEQNPNLKLSSTTQKLYNEYRKVVKFLDIDRPLTDDFRNSAKFLKSYQ